MRGGTIYLRAVAGPCAGRVIAIDDQLSVGRAPSTGLTLDDPLVSRRHATLTVVGRDVVVRDDASLNGTWVNDNRLDMPCTLHAADRLRIGGSEFLVSRSSGAERADTDDPTRFVGR
jgi:S-DNA-T family DNA segregation ATPase FtsK/SpoIIIE